MGRLSPVEIERLLDLGTQVGPCFLQPVAQDVPVRDLGSQGGTEIGRNLFEEIRGGYTDKMSFGFIVDKDEELRTDAEDGRVDILRTITGISKLYDVSAVSIPANNGTSIGAETRSLIDGAINQIQTERSEAEKLELMKKRTELRARALGKEIEK